jgi:ABC-type transport system involved in multi-copper enzyme maturation permease subunit
MALLGGNAISGERVDRSADFLYSLPITRRRLLASKLLFVFAVAAVMWSVNLVVFRCLIGAIPLKPDDYLMFFRAGTLTAITGLTFFCVAWFLSSFVGSPAFNACGGVLLPLIVWSGLWFTAEVLELHVGDAIIVRCYCVACLILATLCFAIGTWHYLRRVEP